MPRSASADSKDSLWPLVRKRTATSDGGWPGLDQRGDAGGDGGGLVGVVVGDEQLGRRGRRAAAARSSTEPERRWPPGPRSTRLARPTTCGVER